MVTHGMVCAVVRVVDHFKRYVWRRKATASVDLAVQMPEPSLRAEQVSSALDLLIRPGSTVVTRSS